MRGKIKGRDEVFMMEAMALARKGGVGVSPNPMVGALLIKNNTVIGSGYHKKFGGPHAEVYAIGSAKKSVRGATLYVNLEPCNIFGKTPPCTDLIISAGISRVVVGTRDPNPLVSGKGIAQLRKAGIDVEVGVLEEECKRLNEAFLKFIRTGMPFVTLKIAQTLDGKIADSRGDSRWITNTSSRKFGHHLRSLHGSVLVGAETLLSDDPMLTVRSVPGRSPLRVVLDGKFRISGNESVFSDKGPKTIVFVSKKYSGRYPSKIKNLKKKGHSVIEMPSDAGGKIRLNNILKTLGSLGISSLLVEGGASTFSSFMREAVVDKFYILIAPKIFGSGVDSFSGLKYNLKDGNNMLGYQYVWNLKGDIVIVAYPR